MVPSPRSNHALFNSGYCIAILSSIFSEMEFLMLLTYEDDNSHLLQNSLMEIPLLSMNCFSLSFTVIV